MRVFAAALMLLACGATAVNAQTFPAKPISLVVPFPAGAANDALAGIIAAEMRESLGTVVIDNRPGGGGSVAGDYVKLAAPDGHTLLVLKRLNAELNRVLKLPAVREELAAQGIEAAGSTPDEFTTRMRILPG